MLYLSFGGEHFKKMDNNSQKPKSKANPVVLNVRFV